MVIQLGNETGRRSGGQTLDSPSLASMITVESADAFALLTSDPENQVLRGKPYHAMVIPHVSSSPMEPPLAPPRNWL